MWEGAKNVLSESLGQTVEKPQGLSGKTSPGGESEAEAFRLSQGGSFTDNPKAFQQFVRLWFPIGAGTDLPKCVVWINFKIAAVKSAHCKSQTAPIGNQSLLRSVLVKQANPRLRRCPNTSVP